MSGKSTAALKMPAAMPVHTVSVTITDGPDRGKRWEGESGTLGTAKDNDLVLGDETVSGYHVRLQAVKHGIKVSDFGSTNGTFFGDARLEVATVPAASTLRLGRTSLEIGRASCRERGAVWV